MTDLDSDSLKFWQSFSEWGFCLVIVGVFGESVDLIAKWLIRCRKRRLPKRVDKWMLPLESVFWIILCVGLAMEFLGGHKAMLIADRQNAILTAKAEQAGKEAAEANKQAAASNERAGKAIEFSSEIASTNAQLSLQTEFLRSKNLELEAKVVSEFSYLKKAQENAGALIESESNRLQQTEFQLLEHSNALIEAQQVMQNVSNAINVIFMHQPQILLPKQREIISKGLKPLNKSGVNIVVAFNKSDWVTAIFADEIIEVLKKAGYTVGKYDAWNKHRFISSSGVSILSDSRQDATNTAALEKVMEDARINIWWRFAPVKYINELISDILPPLNNNEPTYWVFVGSRPEPKSP